MKQFTMIPNQILEECQLSVNARYLFCVLLKYCGNKDYCFPSQKTLAKTIGISERYVRILIKELLEAGLIYISRTGYNRPNTYKISKDLVRNQGSSQDTAVRKDSTYRVGTPVPLHIGTIVPPNNTYIKRKDKNKKNNLDAREKCRKDLIKKGFDLKTKRLNQNPIAIKK